MNESLFKGKLIAAQMMMIVGLSNLPEPAFKRVVARGKEPRQLDFDKQQAAEAKRLRKQMRNIKNEQKSMQS